jgi:hypothetical protein
VVVEGEVEDATVPTVWLVADDLRVAVPVQARRFRRAVVVTASTLRIHAEVPADGNIASRSATVAVHSTSSTEFGIVMIEWPEETGAGLRIDLTGSWRSSPERLDDPARTFVLRAVTGLNAGSTQAFYFRRPRPGVYSFFLRYHGAGAAGEVVPTLYMPRADHLARLTASRIAVNRRPTLLGRVLLPYAVLWEQDEWFTGRSESVDTVTKFRTPEGVTWIERKAGF